MAGGRRGVFSVVVAVAGCVFSLKTMRLAPTESYSNMIFRFVNASKTITNSI